MIAENIKNILASIPEYVSLVAVTKTRTVDEIKEAYDAGIRDFGENKVQEFLSKYDSFESDVRWHLIGHLQCNKVKYIVGKVFLIHSLDSAELLHEIEKRYKKANLQANVLIEINIGEEESKTGIKKEELDSLLGECELCENVKVKGLMAIIPKGNPEECRKYFKNMKNIWDELKEKQYKNITMQYLSMGMSSDYMFACEEGSNMIRIGQGIFGPREYK